MKTKQGISLIVLVITIIVMIILAGAIVLTLNNSGIIDKASEAVDATNYATVKELTQMAWAEAYANGARTQQEFQNAVDKALEDNKVDTDRYGIIVTTNGVEVANGWIQDGLTVKRGDDVLNIGADFDYDETGEGTKDVTWKVLGAENGELLIMSTSDIVESHLLGDPDGDNINEAVNDYLNGVVELDALCEPYGKGENATGARTIRVEDVNKITGYNPETAKYGKGQTYEYGNEVRYSYAGEGKIKYYSKVTAPEKEVSCSTFYYLDATNKLIKADLATGTGIITKLKSDYYYYYASDLETIEYGSDAYTMLFGEDDTYYWLASPYVITYPRYAYFSMRIVDDGDVNGYFLWNSNGNTYCGECGVRAVVSLASDIQI